MGRPTYLWGKTTPLYDNNGRIVSAIESIRDITAQKLAEKELKTYHDHLEELVEERTKELKKINEKLQIEIKKRKQIDKILKQSEKNYRSIFKHAGIGIFQSTPEGKFTNVNITMAHLFGYETPEEMIRSINNIDDDVYINSKRRKKILGMIKKSKGIIKFELEFRRKDGEKWIAELNIRVVRDKNLTLVNSEFELLTGYTKDEVMGRSWTEFVIKEDLDKMMGYREIRNLDPNLAPKNYEFRFIRKDKSIGYAYMNIVNIPGSRQRITSIVDISHRKNAEKELYKINKKLERSNAELEQFAYVASHDLREPLRMITTFLELLEKKYKGQLDADAIEYIKYAVDGAKHLNSMINDLLNYARIAHKEIEFTKIDTEIVLQQTLINLKSMIDDNNAVITYDKLPKISCNEHLLLELFQNLIGNSIKYKSAEPPRIHVSAIEDKNKIIFTIRDNGIGMSAKHLERIFVIFQRLHTREEYEGTGIGLAIAQKIVQQHGGEIWAESEPGKGTTFYFTIAK